MKTRIRLNGTDTYQEKHLICVSCGQYIIKDHKAETPIFYKDHEHGDSYCVKCA